ncbi:hypothetical protein CRE_24229 [Caenorhabditis remanei]|uniref:Uncharacterized protein n=1 Tax=Caenorhabditis remanei TaxID=31234 RepID=E3NCX3_CAERE|nr:hypothetical protein CRE_24229 [Caenorhabditis remanei]
MGNQIATFIRSLLFSQGENLTGSDAPSDRSTSNFSYNSTQSNSTNTSTSSSSNSRSNSRFSCKSREFPSDHSRDRCECPAGFCSGNCSNSSFNYSSDGFSIESTCSCSRHISDISFSCCSCTCSDQCHFSSTNVSGQTSCFSMSPRSRCIHCSLGNGFNQISTFHTDDQILVKIPDADSNNDVKLVLNYLEKRVSSMSHLAPREAGETVMGIQSLRDHFEVLEQIVTRSTNIDTKLNIQSCQQFSLSSDDEKIDHSFRNFKN